MFVVFSPYEFLFVWALLDTREYKWSERNCDANRHLCLTLLYTRHIQLVTQWLVADVAYTLVSVSHLPGFTDKLTADKLITPVQWISTDWSLLHYWQTYLYCLQDKIKDICGIFMTPKWIIITIKKTFYLQLIWWSAMLIFSLF